MVVIVRIASINADHWRRRSIVDRCRSNDHWRRGVDRDRTWISGARHHRCRRARRLSSHHDAIAHTALLHKHQRCWTRIDPAAALANRVDDDFFTEASAGHFNQILIRDGLRRELGVLGGDLLVRLKCDGISGRDLALIGFVDSVADQRPTEQPDAGSNQGVLAAVAAALAAEGRADQGPATSADQPASKCVIAVIAGRWLVIVLSARGRQCRCACYKG